MPSWRIHNKWAARFGIPIDISEYVNHFIDCYSGDRDFEEFCKRNKIRVTKKITTHDANNEKARDVQVAFMSEKGGKYILCWILHRILDIFCFYPDINIIKGAKSSMREEFIPIAEFVEQNYKEIMKDCNEWYRNW